MMSQLHQKKPYDEYNVDDDNGVYCSTEVNIRVELSETNWAFLNNITEQH